MRSLKLLKKILFKVSFDFSVSTFIYFTSQISIIILQLYLQVAVHKFEYNFDPVGEQFRMSETESRSSGPNDDAHIGHSDCHVAESLS